MADSSDGWLIADCNVGLTSVNGELATMDVKIQRRNAAYIAAANPATLLALLDRVDELEGDAERDIIVDDLIIQRDYWEERATELAERVGEHFGFDVGEHSSMNCPVLNALESKWTDPSTERAVPGWQPIETAPVDGKAFLVWVPENKCVFEVISRSYKGAAQMTLFGSFGLEFTHNATHWMPLPAAPGAGGGE